MLNDEQRQPRPASCDRQVDVFCYPLDKAFENIDCMSAILSCQAKNRFYESTQRLI
jgi:hypothetical protein